MRPAALLRLALAGSRTDTVRIVLTAFAAALATLSMLAAATVYAIRPRADVAVREAADHDPTMPGVDPAPDGYAYQYTHNLLVEPGLRPGVVFGLLLLCIPVLALAGQSARLGAPARDRRLARIRLAGATPRQAVAVVVAETGLAALAGTALGMVVYAVGRALLHRPDASGRLPLPTDTAPPLWTVLAIGAGLPLLAALSAALLLRRVAFTPFGVARRHRTRPPW
ncbi:MAG: FtsX-like permease family protein, partial [Micromonosporaceae bacterium]